MTDSPEANDLVELTFKDEYGQTSSIQGRVENVDSDPEIYAAELTFVVNDKDRQHKVVYGEGELDGEEWASVTVYNQDKKLGNNAEWRFLE